MTAIERVSRCPPTTVYGSASSLAVIRALYLQPLINATITSEWEGNAFCQSAIDVESVITAPGLRTLVVGDVSAKLSQLVSNIIIVDLPFLEVVIVSNTLRVYVTGAILESDASVRPILIYNYDGTETLLRGSGSQLAQLRHVYHATPPSSVVIVGTPMLRSVQVLSSVVSFIAVNHTYLTTVDVPCYSCVYINLPSLLTGTSPTLSTVATTGPDVNNNAQVSILINLPAIINVQLVGAVSAVHVRNISLSVFVFHPNVVAGFTTADIRLHCIDTVATASNTLHFGVCDCGKLASFVFPPSPNLRTALLEDVDVEVLHFDAPMEWLSLRNLQLLHTVWLHNVNFTSARLPAAVAASDFRAINCPLLTVLHVITARRLRRMVVVGFLFLAELVVIGSPRLSLFVIYGLPQLTRLTFHSDSMAAMLVSGSTAQQCTTSNIGGLEAAWIKALVVDDVNDGSHGRGVIVLTPKLEELCVQSASLSTLIATDVSTMKVFKFFSAAATIASEQGFAPAASWCDGAADTSQLVRSLLPDRPRYIEAYIFSTDAFAPVAVVVTSPKIRGIVVDTIGDVLNSRMLFSYLRLPNSVVSLNVSNSQSLEHLVINAMPQLEVLDVSNCSFSWLAVTGAATFRGLSAKSVPVGLQYIPSLDSVLGGCLIRGVPSLTSLYVASNARMQMLTVEHVPNLTALVVEPATGDTTVPDLGFVTLFDCPVLSSFLLHFMVGVPMSLALIDVGYGLNLTLQLSLSWHRYTGPAPDPNPPFGVLRSACITDAWSTQHILKKCDAYVGNVANGLSPFCNTQEDVLTADLVNGLRLTCDTTVPPACCLPWYLPFASDGTTAANRTSTVSIALTSSMARSRTLSLICRPSCSGTVLTATRSLEHTNQFVASKMPLAIASAFFDNDTAVLYIPDELTRPVLSFNRTLTLNFSYNAHDCAIDYQPKEMFNATFVVVDQSAARAVLLTSVVVAVARSQPLSNTFVVSVRCFPNTNVTANITIVYVDAARRTESETTAAVLLSPMLAVATSLALLDSRSSLNDVQRLSLVTSLCASYDKDLRSSLGAVKLAVSIPFSVDCIVVGVFLLQLAVASAVMRASRKTFSDAAVQVHYPSVTLQVLLALQTGACFYAFDELLSGTKMGLLKTVANGVAPCLTIVAVVATLRYKQLLLGEPDVLWLRYDSVFKPPTPLLSLFYEQAALVPVSVHSTYAALFGDYRQSRVSFAIAPYTMCVVSTLVVALGKADRISCTVSAALYCAIHAAIAVAYFGLRPFATSARNILLGVVNCCICASSVIMLTRLPSSVLMAIQTIAAAVMTLNSLLTVPEFLVHRRHYAELAATISDDVTGDMGVSSDATSTGSDLSANDRIW